MTEIDEAVFDRTLRSAVGAALERYGSAVRPVLVHREGHRNPEVVGSCVLLAVGDRRFALTAAHVADYMIATGTIFIGGSEDVVEITPWNAHGTPSDEGRDDDNLDIAFSEISDECAAALGDVVWLRPEQVSLQTVPAGSGLLMVASGFPVRDAELQYGTTHFDATPHAYPAAVSPAAAYEEHGFDPEANVLVDYDRFRMAGRSGPTVRPEGMSGGALWHLPSSDLARTDELILVGILIAWRERGCKVMVATHAVYALVMIAKVHPELRELLGV